MKNKDGGDYMASYTKHMYCKDIDNIKKELSKILKTLVPVLPQNYNCDTIVQLLQEYYPLEWQLINEKYEYYSIKDKSLVRFEKKKRYSMSTPLSLLQSLDIYNRIFSKQYVDDHIASFSSETYLENVRKFTALRSPKIKSRIDKLEQAKKKAQAVEPAFLDALIGLYNRKTTSQKDRIYILLELEKYYCPKVIKFLCKNVDTEYNRQLRELSFYHLQSWGHFSAPLRRQKYMRIPSKNKKRRKYLKSIYANERFNIKAIPEELEYRIENSKEQLIKSFDFFISHSSNDYSLVQRLIQNLNEKNCNVYCDWINDTDYLKRKLVCEATLRVIEKRIEQSKSIMFVGSQYSYNSKWVKYELNYAYSLRKPIYIVNVDAIAEGKFSYEPCTDIWFFNENYKNIQLFEDRQQVVN